MNRDAAAHGSKSPTPASESATYPTSTPNNRSKLASQRQLLVVAAACAAGLLSLASVLQRVEVFNGEALSVGSAGASGSDYSNLNSSSLPFVHARDLAAIDVSAHGAAPGCPATGLCRMEHVFDEILVIGLARRATQLRRVRAQLAALGTPYTLVQAYDGRTINAAELRRTWKHEELASASTLGLFLTHLDIWAYIARSPRKTFLLLEDDVILHRNFPVAFDARMRRITGDWRALFLGSVLRDVHSGNLNELAFGGWHPEADAAAGFFRPAKLWGSWAVAVHRDAAAVLDAAMRRTQRPIDQTAYENVFQEFQGACFIMWPMVAMTTNAVSDLRPGYTLEMVKYRWAYNGWTWKDFDSRTGYRITENSTAAIAAAVPVRVPSTTAVQPHPRPQYPAPFPPESVSAANVTAAVHAQPLPLPTFPPPVFPASVAIGVLAYNPILKVRNNVGDWYQSAAAVYSWWTFLTGGTASSGGDSARSFAAFVNHSIHSHGRPSPVWPAVIWLDRDAISDAQLPPGVKRVITVMNGWWMHPITAPPASSGGRQLLKRKGGNQKKGDPDEAPAAPAYNFPSDATAPWLVPIFISVHVVNPQLLNVHEVVNYLQAHGPVGCRDQATYQLMAFRGIPSYFSGCITPLMGIATREGCGAFDNSSALGAPSQRNKQCAVDTPWLEPTHQYFRQNPSSFIMDADPIWLRRTLLKYCTAFRNCPHTDTSRLHVWFPLRMNGYSALLYNKATRGVVEPLPRGAGAGVAHPGVAIDGAATNRFGGLLEAAYRPESDKMLYKLRLMSDLIERMHRALGQSSSIN